MEDNKSSEKSDKVSFYTKLNEMRMESNGLDWEPDKFVPLGGTKGYHYISIYKMKRNLAPIFAKHKVEFIPNYYNIEIMQTGNVTQWVARLEARMIDTETGYETSARTIGCAPVTDKGPTIAMSFALKQWLSDQFLLIDGIIDPEEGETATTVPAKTFVKKEPKEEENAKSQILAKSIRPLEPVPPKAEPAVVKAEEPASASVSAAAPAQGYVPEDKEGIPSPQMKAIKNIFSVRTTWAQTGKMSAEEYNQMSADYLEVNDGQSAVVFIKKYRVI